MIKQIEIDKTPPYVAGKQTINPKKVNFLFGLNGSGKTTISRYLRSPQQERYADCKTDWYGAAIECCVYNTDYVKDNFLESSIHGIFTLGEENIEIKQEIDTLNKRLKDISEKKNALEVKLNGNEETKGLNKELVEHEATYSDIFWKIKQQLDNESSPILLALTGVRGSKDTFKSTLLEQFRLNEAELKEKSELEHLCKTLFDANIENANSLNYISFDELVSFETEPILGTVIVGKEDVDIAALIKRLGNDAWFRQGVQYLEHSEGKCPFCQEPLKDDFKQKVEEYFDESYLKALEEIETLCKKYIYAAEKIMQNVSALENVSPDFVNKDELGTIIKSLSDKIDTNLKEINLKKDSPNIVIQLDSMATQAAEIKRIIDMANKAISEHNERVANIKTEKSNLTSQAWRYILSALTRDIDAYKKKKSELNDSIAQASNELSEIKTAETIAKTELRNQEQKLTSVAPTARKINELLSDYGITSFSLKVADDQKSYQFIRDNGTPAYESLSEGERNLVTFLYFMYSLKGNIDNSGHNNDKVVVIDDPVSSLDNDILFLVSSLIRDLLADIYEGTGTIKQLFVLSHNLYFFKEVTYHKGIKPKATGYWMIVKSNNATKIIEHQENPVTSTYEMLWEEIKKASANNNEINTTTLANAMRRVLEYYFKFLGGIDLNTFHKEFPEGERQVFKSLISWVNSGSHSAFDDFSAAPNIYDTEKYLKVFKDLFYKAKHESHYNMMMEISEEKENE